MELGQPVDMELGQQSADVSSRAAGCARHPRPTQCRERLPA
jgi:hypothetical protein